jgi:hypothetical protein
MNSNAWGTAFDMSFLVPYSRFPVKKNKKFGECIEIKTTASEFSYNSTTAR